MPGTRSLAADLGLSRGTVVQAFSQLVAEGWLVGVAGSGTVVGTVPAGSVPSAPDGRAAPQDVPPGIDLRPGRPDLSAFPRTRGPARVPGSRRSAPVPGRSRGGAARAAPARIRRAGAADRGGCPTSRGDLHGLHTGGYWHRPELDRPGALVIGYATPAGHAWRRALDALTELLR